MGNYMEEERYKRFRDSYGMIHNREYHISENGPLFTAVFFIVEALNGRFHSFDPSVLCVEGSRYVADPVTEGTHFSHDNMTGLYTLQALYGPEDLDKLPILKWNDRWWMHPRDFLFYLTMQGSVIGLILSFLLMPIFMWHTMRRQGGESSGKQLWFLRIMALNFNPRVDPRLSSFLQKVAAIFIKRYSCIKLSIPEYWYEVLYTYYTHDGKWQWNLQHPTLESFRELKERI